MDWPPEFSTGRPSPRRELQLQGPRPTPLKVRKESHKINKKPPTVPQISQNQHNQHQHHQQQQPQQQRQPVIIYTVSPKVIHTHASEFMSLVQRLTGPSPRPCPSPSSGAISPAARFATIEKTNTPSEADKSFRYYNNTIDINEMMFSGGMDIVGADVERTGSFPGILSPLPSSLPLISPNFFSPPSDHNSFNFLHDLSPMFNGPFTPSPRSAFLTAPITSPNLPFDLFNQFLDF